MSFNITKVLFMVYADGQLETEHHLLLELLWAYNKGMKTKENRNCLEERREKNMLTQEKRSDVIHRRLETQRLLDSAILC